MYPHERSLVKQLNGKPFALIGVNSDDDVEALRETVKEKKLTWRSFQNEGGVDGRISDAWGIQGWPTVYIIDAEGVIRWKGGGPNDKLIETLLAEIGHEVELSHDDEEHDHEEEGDEEEDDEKAEEEGDDDATPSKDADDGR